jgi:hypothetical protein
MTLATPAIARGSLFIRAGVEALPDFFSRTLIRIPKLWLRGCFPAAKPVELQWRAPHGTA